VAGYGGRMRHGFLSRVPVWAWRGLMAHLGPGERRRFNIDPIEAVDYHLDLDYAGDGIRAHRLDVMVPHRRDAGPLPVYVYFHGGGWTSGDKSSLTKYCASQALAGMVVVNVNYRMATTFRMRHMLHDANTALDWVHREIAGYGGDPDNIVLGGDSAGGHIAAMLAATATRPELAGHYDLVPSVGLRGLRGLVQHCSIVDISVIFERGFILSLNFIRMLLPASLSAGVGEEGGSPRAAALRKAAVFLSPIEWLDPAFPPVLVTTSERDYFYRANLNFVAALRLHSVPVETLIYDRRNPNTAHTWQQDAGHPESQEVYRRLQSFVRRVTLGLS
jgi:acetyl esterase